MTISMNESVAAKLQSDPAALAALLQMLGGEAATQQPKAAAEYNWAPIPRDWSVGFDIIRELRSRQYDSEAVVTSAEVEPTKNRPGYPEGVVARWEDGEAITFGDLLYVVEGGATNANGEAVNDYPNVWSLSWPEAKGALHYLRSCPKKPSASGNKPKGRNGGGKAANTDSGQGEALKAIMAALAAMQVEVAELRGEAPKNVPAKPEPAIGHRKAPAKPVAAKPEPAKPVELTPGQTVVWQDQHYVLTLQANGRIGMQKVV